MTLIEFGWNEEWEEKYESQETEEVYTIGRVISQHSFMYKVVTKTGIIPAELSGKIRGVTIGKKLNWEAVPVVGDWILTKEYKEEEKAIIHGILPRKNSLSRKSAGKGVQEQKVAANMDYLFIVTSLNNDFNIRRIERFLVLAWENQITPVIILTKTDLCGNVQEKVNEVSLAAPGVPIHAISSRKKEGLDQLIPYFTDGKTVGLLGSSGVGKSTLVNAICEEEVQKVNDIRKGDDKGKHTTTHRELIQLPYGGVAIDTPGMREIQMLDVHEGLNKMYKDIEKLAELCQFNDCIHQKEPGCAVKKAIEEGIISNERVESYNKLQKEVAEYSFKLLGSTSLVEKELGKRYAQILATSNYNKNSKYRRY